MRRQILTLILLNFLFLNACNNAQTPNEVPDEQLNKSIETFIRENPEVIVEALNDYAAREQANETENAKDVIRQKLPALLASDDGFVTGAPAERAKVIVVEFMDYHCGYCKKATNKMSALAADADDITVVFRELPILREESILAAKYALAARAQGKYLDYHIEMMKSSGVLTKSRLDSIAQETGLNSQTLAENAQSLDHDKSINNTREIAMGIGLSGTPAFVVANPDGTYVEIIHGWSVEKLNSAIEEARNAA